MKQTGINFSNLSRGDRIKLFTVMAFMVILLVILGFLIGMLLKKQSFGFSQATLPGQGMATSLPATASNTGSQSVDCPPSELVLGTTTFQIQALTPGADGSLPVPADTSGIAYHIEGTGSGTVFILSPTPQNISAMSTVSTGSPATLQGPGCTRVTYSLAAPQAGPLDGSVFAGQSNEEITVFLPTTASGEGFTFRGRQVTEPVLALNPPTTTIESIPALPATAENTTNAAAESTAVPLVVLPEQNTAAPTVESVLPTPTSSIPTPDYSEVLAEIGVLNTGSTGLFGLGSGVKIEVSVYNFGTLPFTLSESNVTLTQPDGTPLALKSSDPGFPLQIHPGETKTIKLTFEKPSSPTATLKILTVEYDIEGY